MNGSFTGLSRSRRAGVAAGLLAIVFLGGTAAVSHAQARAHPQRPFRGLFGGGGARDPQAARTTVSLLLGASGSYDEHLAPRDIGGGSSADPSTAPAGSIGAFNGTLQVEHVRAGTTFGLDGSGFVSRYSSEPAEITGGGSLDARVNKAFGRDDRNSMFA